MLPKHHLLLGFIFSLILFPFIGLIGSLIVFFSSFLIDVDHYLFYVFTRKDISLKNAYIWFLKRRNKFLALPKSKRRNFPFIPCFLHGIEILIILFFLGFFISYYFYFILSGFTFHLFLDITWEIKHKSRINKISLIYDFIKFRKYD